MTKSEVVGLLAYLTENTKAEKLDGDAARRRVEAWHITLAPYDGRIVMEAAVGWVRSGQKQAPEASELCAKINELEHGALPSEVEAWQVCTSNLTAEQREALHPMLRHVLQITGGISSIAYMDAAEAKRYVRGAFHQALSEHRIKADPELRRAPDSERLLSGPRMIGGGSEAG